MRLQSVKGLKELKAEVLQEIVEIAKALLTNMARNSWNDNYLPRCITIYSDFGNHNHDTDQVAAKLKFVTVLSKRIAKDQP